MTAKLLIYFGGGILSPLSFSFSSLSIPVFLPSLRGKAASSNPGNRSVKGAGVREEAFMCISTSGNASGILQNRAISAEQNLTSVETNVFLPNSTG